MRDAIVARPAARACEVVHCCRSEVKGDADDDASAPTKLEDRRRHASSPVYRAPRSVSRTTYGGSPATVLRRRPRRIPRPRDRGAPPTLAGLAAEAARVRSRAIPWPASQALCAVSARWSRTSRPVRARVAGTVKRGSRRRWGSGRRARWSVRVSISRPGGDLHGQVDDRAPDLVLGEVEQRERAQAGGVLPGALALGEPWRCGCGPRSGPGGGGAARGRRVGCWARRWGCWWRTR